MTIPKSMGLVTFLFFVGVELVFITGFILWGVITTKLLWGGKK